MSNGAGNVIDDFYAERDKQTEDTSLVNTIEDKEIFYYSKDGHDIVLVDPSYREPWVHVIDHDGESIGIFNIEKAEAMIKACTDLITMIKERT